LIFDNYLEHSVFKIQELELELLRGNFIGFLALIAAVSFFFSQPFGRKKRFSE
jgi:hypothetical protein